MKQIFALLLAFAMCLTFAACAKEDHTAQLQELTGQVEQLQSLLKEMTGERDGLKQQLEAAQQENAQLQQENEQLRQSVEALTMQVQELLFPPMTQSGTIRLFGYEEPVLTDGKSEYVHFTRFVEVSGLTDTAPSREWQGEDYISLDEIVALENIVLDETVEGVRYLAKVKQLGAPTPDVNVPILMYHAVSDDLWGISELFVKPAEMEKQLAWLVENGYDPIWFEDLSHLEDYDKPVILTFDDGYDDNYTELYPLLQKYNVKATVFVIGKPNGTAHKMTEEQVTEMSKSGLVSIQSHTMTHGDLSTMNEKTLESEFLNSIKEISALTGEVPYALCYPSGRFSQLTLDVAERYFTYGTKMNGMLYNTEDDPYTCARYYVARNTDLATFKIFCSGAGT